MTQWVMLFLCRRYKIKDGGGIILNKIKNSWNDIKRISLPAVLLLITTMSVCLPYPITCFLLLTLVFFVLFRKKLRDQLVKVKGFSIICFFSLYAMIIPLFYQRWLGVIVGFFMMIGFIYMLYVQSVLTFKLYHMILDCICVSSIACFIIAVIQKLSCGYLFRATGGLLNANYYGMIIEFVILICIYRIITNPNKSKWYIPIVIVNIVGVFLCDCQSAWLAIIAGVLILLYCNGFKKHAIFFLLIASVLVVIGVTVPGVLPRWDRMPQTFATRLDIWKTAFKGISEYPLFGQGPMSFLLNHKTYGGYLTQHAHSIYLDPLLCYGVVGVGTILIYIVTVIRFAKNNLALKKSPEVTSIVLAIFVASLIHGITDFPLMWVQTGMLFVFIISGVFVNSSSEEKNENKKLDTYKYM